jgi:superfamily II DNA helicase RecQ
VEDALRAWRREEAKRAGVPAFRILTDRTLRAIAARMPADETELLSISGVSARIAEKYGAGILHVLGGAL